MLLYNILGDRFSWEDSEINENGLLTVSSSWPYKDSKAGWLTEDKITDGLSNTFWHTGEIPGWMNYDLNTAQTITDVTIGVRPGLCFCYVLFILKLKSI